MCKQGSKLAVVRRIPNHPTTFGRNFEYEMIFASLWPFRARLSLVRILGLVLGLLLSLVKCFSVLYVQHVKENGRDYNTVDGRSKRKCYWTRASCDCGRLQIGDVTREVEFLSNEYTNPNANPKTLTTLALALADHHDAFESFCAPGFCYFVRNYSCTVDGAVVTSKENRRTLTLAKYT